MNLHEWQSKELFRKFGLPVSNGCVVGSIAEVRDATRKLAGDRWAIKVQVHAGGRGKAGGVKVVGSAEEAGDFAEQWIGNRIHTVQTDEFGQPVNQLYLEELAEIERELYLGAVIDRADGNVVVMASSEGGVEIEKVAAETPEKIHRIAVSPAIGVQDYQGRQLAYALSLEGQQVNQFVALLKNLCGMFNDLDCSLVEINPLVVTQAGDVHCLDAKVSIDGNALFRHPEIAKLKDESQDDEREVAAAKFNLNYVALDGSIGCMVNGAGLAMATMDVVKLHGGEPANFLDVGGSVNTESVSEAFKIILADPNVKAVLINIFGGIVSCETIADGIIAAVKDVGVDVPIVVRFDGNNAQIGAAKIADSGLNIKSASTLQDAAKSVVALV